MSLGLTIFIAFLFSCCMTSIIWMVQSVHYPSFHYIEQEKFKDFHKFHVRSISRIVMPLMLLELLSSLGFVYFAFEHSIFSLALIQFVLLLGIWLSTFCLSVPLHNKLKENAKSEDIQKLIQTNWPRSILWTLKSLILGYCLVLINTF